jgi:hypothetical protein
MSDCMNTEKILFLTLPHALGLPALDRNQRATSQTLELLHQQWSLIEAMVRSGQVAEGIAQMEGLAREMQARMKHDPKPWWESLMLSRRMVYENMVHAAEWGECVAEARAALKRCQQWDGELRSQLESLLENLGQEE